MSSEEELQRAKRERQDLRADGRVADEFSVPSRPSGTAARASRWDSAVVVVRREPSAAETAMAVDAGPPPMPAPTSTPTPTPMPDYKPISENVFMVTRRRSRERMVCDCSFVPGEDDPEDACGDACLNRQLFIECSKTHCPCGKHCTNTLFQSKRWADLEVFDAGRKGRGLRARQPIHAGQFVAEYCGEVYDSATFDLRREEYARKGFSHFYFMSLDSDLIIDATYKGAVSRFINHSCNPNCETQKWNVNGETRIGFFARKAISSGEEITFDYKYERYGEKAQPCYCESANCRGSLGGSKEGGPRRRASGPGSKKRNAALAALKEHLAVHLTAEGGVGSDSGAVVLVRCLSQADTPTLKEYLLNILRNTQDTQLMTMINYRCLDFLRGWLQADASGDGDSGNGAAPQPDPAVVRLVLDILSRFPLKARNPLTASHMLETVQAVAAGEDGVAALQAASLLSSWSALKEIYVIPTKRKKVQDDRACDSILIPVECYSIFTRSRQQEVESRCGVMVAVEERDDGRWAVVRARAHDASAGQAAIAAARNVLTLMVEQERANSAREMVMRLKASTSRKSSTDNRRQSEHDSPLLPTFSSTDAWLQNEGEGELPDGWTMAQAADGRVYYYNHQGDTTWTRPVVSGSDVLKKLLSKPNKTAIAGSRVRTAEELQNEVSSLLANGSATTAEAAPEQAPPQTESAPLDLSEDRRRREERRKRKERRRSVESKRKKLEKLKQQKQMRLEARRKAAAAVAAAAAARRHNSSSNSKFAGITKTGLSRQQFRTEIGPFIVEVLNRYRKPECKYGRIACSDDFKHLARKLTHVMAEKEHKRQGSEMVFDDAVRKKMKNFVLDYMKKLGPVYMRKPTAPGRSLVELAAPEAGAATADAEAPDADTAEDRALTQAILDQEDQDRLDQQDQSTVENDPQDAEDDAELMALELELAQGQEDEEDEEQEQDNEDRDDVVDSRTGRSNGHRLPPPPPPPPPPPEGDPPPADDDDPGENSPPFVDEAPCP
eukprot:m.221004 g.221004  ORF g.221004 m.221004 type:complete len:1009 (+) comp22283_c0_seq2:107-3133(+)